STGTGGERRSAGLRADQAARRKMQNMAAHSRAADTGSRLAGPIEGASSAVSKGPVKAPRLPPAEMNPYSRRACSLRNRSAMKLQKTDTTNRLNTLTHTKNACAMRVGARSDSMRP